MCLAQGPQPCDAGIYAGQKYYRRIQGEHSAILLTCIKLQFDIKIFVLSIFEWPLKTGFTVCLNYAIVSSNKRTFLNFYAFGYLHVLYFSLFLCS